MTVSVPDTRKLRRSPLASLHGELGGKMVPFAGYEMPVQYGAGIVAEHLHTRAAASLFDVSHMGQIALRGADAARALERLVPGDIAGLAAGAMRYTMFTNDGGGILDDLMVTQRGDHLFLVVNAGCKEADLAHLSAALGPEISVEPSFDRGLIALQGPAAVAVVARYAPEASAMSFMSMRAFDIGGISCLVSRSGYSGEDGVEISVAAVDAEALARLLLAAPEVEAAGLGARDSLRLEAGLCLYGHDIDTTTTPVEAGLSWAIGKRRRAEGGFPGDEIILGQIANGATRRRVGMRPEGRVVAREGTKIMAGERCIGIVTSGGYGPSVGGPIAMGYVEADRATVGAAIEVMVRGQGRAAKIEKLPFIAPSYHRG